MRTFILLATISAILIKPSIAQVKHQIRVTDPIMYWYGLDFSILSVYDYTLLEQGEYVKNTLCPAWQGYFKEQVSDKKLKKWFRKSVLYDQSSQFFKSADSLNPDSLVQIDGLKTQMTADELKSHLKSFDLKETKGLGFVAIVKTLSREDKTASVICVFFDIESREPLSVFGETGRQGNGDAVSVYGDAIKKAIRGCHSDYRYQVLGQ